MSERSKQLSKTLQFFYQNPMAAVSMELFLTVGLVLFLGAFAIRPTLLTMSDLLKEIDDKRHLNEQLNQKVAALATAQSEYLALESRLFVLDQAIPSEPNVMEAVKILEKTAAEQSLIISSVSVSELPEKDASASATEKVSYVPITLSLTGDYPGIRRFVEAIKTNRRIFAVDTVIFTTGQELQRKTLHATITMNVPYFQK